MRNRKGNQNGNKVLAVIIVLLVLGGIAYLISKPKETEKKEIEEDKGEIIIEKTSLDTGNPALDTISFEEIESLFNDGPVYSIEGLIEEP